MSEAISEFSSKPHIDWLMRATPEDCAHGQFLKLSPSCPGKATKLCFARRCPGHPRSSRDRSRTWMAGTKPGHDGDARRAKFVEADQCDLGCPVLFAKTIRFSFDPNHFISRAVSSHQRGGSRSSRTRDGMRWTLMVLLTNST